MNVLAEDNYKRHKNNCLLSGNNMEDARVCYYNVTPYNNVATSSKERSTNMCLNIMKYKDSSMRYR